MSLAQSHKGSAKCPWSVCPIHHKCYAQISLHGEKCHTNDRIWAKQMDIVLQFHTKKCAQMCFFLSYPEPLLWLSLSPSGSQSKPLVYIVSLKVTAYCQSLRSIKCQILTSIMNIMMHPLMDGLTHQFRSEIWLLYIIIGHSPKSGPWS